jgi:hypothetical protein
MNLDIITECYGQKQSIPKRTGTSFVVLFHSIIIYSPSIEKAKGVSVTIYYESMRYI